MSEHFFVSLTICPSRELNAPSAIAERRSIEGIRGIATMLPRPRTEAALCKQWIFPIGFRQDGLGLAGAAAAFSCRYHHGPSGKIFRAHVAEP